MNVSEAASLNNFRRAHVAAGVNLSNLHTSCGRLLRSREEPDVVVIGSQAILGSYSETQLPDEAIGSIEVDVTFFDDWDAAKSDKVDGAIGELSRRSTK